MRSEAPCAFRLASVAVARLCVALALPRSHSLMPVTFCDICAKCCCSWKAPPVTSGMVNGLTPLMSRTLSFAPGVETQRAISSGATASCWYINIVLMVRAMFSRRMSSSVLVATWMP